MIIVIIILILLLIYFILDDGIHTRKLSINDNKIIKEFEKKMSHYYPLGKDEFRISHGNNYFKFFDRIGYTHLQGCFYKNKLIATACGVLRDTKYGKTWYICDLKVDEKYRGKMLTRRMLMKTWYNMFYSNRFYGISMNNDKDNKIKQLIKKMPIINIKDAGTLHIYSMNYDEIIIALPIIKKYRKKASFVSLKGIKDLILKSNNEPLPLLHLEYHDNGLLPQEGSTHMFCCHESDPMFKEFNESNITATIVQYGMDNFDWDFIQTSEI